MQNNASPLAAIFDSVSFHGIDTVRSTAEWDALTCDEQMLIEQFSELL